LLEGEESAFALFASANKLYVKVHIVVVVVVVVDDDASRGTRPLVKKQIVVVACPPWLPSRTLQVRPARVVSDLLHVVKGWLILTSLWQARARPA